MSASKKKTGAHAAAGPPLLTAAQIEKDCPVEVQALGNRIAAHLQKMRDYEAKAHEKAGVELRKADDHWRTVTQLLAEAKAKCDVGGFKAFKEKYCPNLSRSRIYELLAIGSGKKTLEEIRAEKRESVAKSRAKVSTTDPPVVDKPEADHVTQTLLESGEVITSPAVTLPPGSGNETKANGKDGGADTDAPTNLINAAQNASENKLSVPQCQCANHISMAVVRGAIYIGIIDDAAAAASPVASRQARRKVLKKLGAAIRTDGL